MKEVYILRAVPGSGKSMLADSLGGVICCADDYFVDEAGNYNFDSTKLWQAHKDCRRKFSKAIEDGEHRIVVANTNVDRKDVEYYRDIATGAGYTVFVLVVENWHNGNDVHNVPQESKQRMADKLSRSIKLLPCLLMLLLAHGVFGQVSFDTLYAKVKHSGTKFPGLIVALAVAESGYNSADEDSFLMISNNIWVLTKNSKCGCAVDSVTGLARYANIDSSIADMNRRIGRLISACSSEEQAITVLAWYYLQKVDRHMEYEEWKKRLTTIRNDTPLE